METAQGGPGPRPISRPLGGRVGSRGPRVGVEVSIGPCRFSAEAGREAVATGARSCPACSLRKPLCVLKGCHSARCALHIQVTRHGGASGSGSLLRVKFRRACKAGKTSFSQPPRVNVLPREHPRRKPIPASFRVGHFLRVGLAGTYSHRSPANTPISLCPAGPFRRRVDSFTLLSTRVPLSGPLARPRALGTSRRAPGTLGA